MTRPRWVVEETKDLEMLARIAGGRRHTAQFYEDEIDEGQAHAFERLGKYGLVRVKTFDQVVSINTGTYRVVYEYRLTKEGKQAYSDALEGIEKHLPAPDER